MYATPFLLASPVESQTPLLRGVLRRSSKTISLFMSDPYIIS
jgi:hypothetical protein